MGLRDAGEDNAHGGGNAHNRSTQLAQVMKDLMEIFIGINQQKVNEGYQNPQMPIIMQKIAQTSEQNNLVILSSLAQNLLQQYQLPKGTRAPSNPTPIGVGS